MTTPAGYTELICQDSSDLLGSSTAILSADGTYRYLLTRTWSAAPPMTWIMLNPSTADGLSDDPTIRRCTGFARREGCGGIKVVNLYALRATDPGELWPHPDPVGTDNDRIIAEHARDGLVVAAWGCHGMAVRRGLEVAQRLAAAGTARLLCAGVTAAGHPRHPLYVRADAPLIPWEPQQ